MGVRKGHVFGPRSHCKRGHPMTPQNVLVSHRSTGGINRVCRECTNARNRARRAELRKTNPAWVKRKNLGVRKAYWKAVEQRRAYARTRYWSDPDRFRLEARKYNANKNWKTAEHRKRGRELHRTAIRELWDIYIKRIIIDRNKNLRNEDIPDSLVQLKRAQVLLRRAIKAPREIESVRIAALIGELKKEARGHRWQRRAANSAKS